MGSIGLFAALAAVMYLTRGIDWYGLQIPDGSRMAEKEDGLSPA
jgi:inner membrane protein involved in colicin E2 resistance